METCGVCGYEAHSGYPDHCSSCNRPNPEHKISEEGSGAMYVHQLTNYLCCACFSRLVGNCENWPTFAHKERHEWAFRSPLGPEWDNV